MDPNLPKVAGTAPDVRELEPGNHFWCSCGLSASQPFCDGSHKGTGLGPVKIAIGDAPKSVALCNCKQSKNPPYCDGSHSRLQLPHPLG